MSKAGAEGGLEDHLVDLCQSDAISDGAVGVLANRLGVSVEGIEGEEVQLCPECQDAIMQVQETCSLCPNCGFSPCS